MYLNILIYVFKCKVYIKWYKPFMKQVMAATK